MAADAISCRSTSHKDDSDVDSDIPAYENSDVHSVTGSKKEAEVEALTMRKILSTQHENANC